MAAACSSKSSGSAGGGSDAGAQSGVVPPELRDVEREGEGLVTTTFADYPAHMADWTRAAGVLALLKTVWGKAKSMYPGLPATQSQMVDDAIAKLDVAIPAQDQKTAAYASNKVGLAVPELFDFFHPDSPIGVIRLDAGFRQVGIDAHYGDWAGVVADIAELKSDWANTKGPVAQKAPTCHRVSGTTEVSGKIDASLANIDTAVAAMPMDANSIEVESGNGALEIDTLELLFDCPPDAMGAPTSGLGSPCTASTSCGPGLACDTANAGGRCAPDSSNKLGTPCMVSTDCGTDPRTACNTAAGDNYPGGYCFAEPCDDINVCPVGGTCVAIGGETPGCYKSCTADSDCRTAEGYVCQLFVTTPPTGFGPSDHACAFKCTRDPDCQSPLKCDVATSKCTP
jgi:hypothetical protein